MKNKAILLLFGISFSIFSKAQNVNKALDLFLNNKTSEAELALLKIANDAQNTERAKAAVALSVIYKLNENDEEKVKYYVQGVKNLENPDPYIYTFWGNCRFVNYPTYAQQVIDFYATRKQIHPDIQYVLNNLKRSNLERANRFDSILLMNKRFGYIDKWEMLGSFDYGDGYGFGLDEGTLAHPENNFEFVGSNGGKFSWFSIIDSIDVSRFFLADYIDIGSNGKAYLQTFIQSPIDQEITLNIIAGTDIRCWMNDALVLQNRKNIEFIGSLPYRFTVKLKSGTNRLLFQLGKKTNYGSNFEVYCTNSNQEPVGNITYQIADKKYTKDESKPKAITDPIVESFNAIAFEQYGKEHPNDLLEQILRVEEFNSNSDKTKTLLAIKGLRLKYPNSYYVSNMYYNNKSNVSYSSKDDYLNHNCEDCFSTLMQKYNEAKSDNTKTKEKAALAKLEEKYPNNYTVQMAKIDKLIEDNEYSEANKLIEECIKKYDNKMEVYSYKSSLLTAQGKKDENAAFLKSILPNMTNTGFSSSLAEYYLDKNDTVNWRKIWQQDVKFSNSDEDYYTLTNMYKNSKKYDSAEIVMKKLLLKKPYSATVLERYGDLLIDKGNKPEALKYFKKSLAYYPQDYQLLKKIKDNTGEKMELEILSPKTIKEMYAIKKVNKIEVPASLSNRNWVLLLKKETSVVYDGALNKTKGYYFYKIIKDAGIKEFKELPNSGDESELLVFSENGEISLPEGYGTWVLPNLKVGDIIGIKYETSLSSTGMKSTLYQNVSYINDNAPIVDLDGQILITKSLNVSPQFFGNTKEFKIEKKEWDKNFDMYTVTAHNPLFVEGEQHSVDAYANHTFTALSNYKSWDEVAKWYWDIASPTIVPNDSITQIVKEVLKSNKNATQYQKAQLLYSWLEKNINYSSQSFRQDNYVPQMPNKVVEDKLGDCKDVAALYLLMCREAGIKGNFVLVNMETYASIYSKFPNNGFNHCIAKIYPDGKPIYVELTSKYLPFGHNTHYAGYAYGLEIDTAKQCNIAPVYNANKGDCMDLVSEIKVDNGNVLIHEKVATIGVTSAMVKDAFEKADSTQINTALQKLISNFMPNSKVNSCSYNVNDVNNDSIVLNYNLGNNDLYIDVAELQIYKVPTYLSKIVEESIFANNTRKTDLSFTLLAGLQSMADNHITIDIPSGKSLYKTPTDIKMNNKYFDFEVTYTVSKEALKINKHFLIKQEVISTNEFADFKTEMEKAFKADVLTVVMQ